jgi:predicted ATPase
MASLNLQAGLQSKASLAYDAALDYGRSGLRLLESNPWQENYGLALSLHEMAAAAAYLSGNRAQTNRYISAVLAQATAPLDTVKSCDIKLQALISQGDLKGAIAAQNYTQLTPKKSASIGSGLLGFLMDHALSRSSS